MIQNLFINLGFSGIQTHALCLVTGNHYLPKSTIFKTKDSKKCSEYLFEESWQKFQVKTYY